MDKSTCWSCGHEWEHDKVVPCEHYPCGPCPSDCPKCNESVCPCCGGALTKESEYDEIRNYCGNSCERCDYEHCGGCV